LSDLRFRDLITGGKSIPLNLGMPYGQTYESTLKWNADNPGTVTDAGALIATQGVVANVPNPETGSLAPSRPTSHSPT